MTGALTEATIQRRTATQSACDGSNGSGCHPLERRHRLGRWSWAEASSLVSSVRCAGACDGLMTVTREPIEPVSGGALRARDAELMVAGDFEAFYAKEIRNVVGLVYVLSGSRVAAEDLAQDAFVAAYRHWDRLRSYENAGAWVRRVAVNRAISNGRRLTAEAKARLRLRQQRVVIPELADHNEDLWTAVRRLPRRQAQTIALHYWDGLSVHEISIVLELSEPTVKTHLQRGRETLAALFPKESAE